MSPKTRRQATARRACVIAVVERDKTCQFPIAFRDRAHLLTREQYERAAADIFCIGELTAHEPGHRRNVDPTDPNSCVAMCWLHNQLLEDMPLVGYALGLLERANGTPIRKVPFGGGHVAIVDRPDLYDQEDAS